MISGIHSILKEALNVIQYSRIISYYKPKQYSNVEYIYVVNDSQVVGNPIPTLGHFAKNGEMKKWFVANQRKLSTASLWTTFRIMWAPPPGQKEAPPGQKEVHCLWLRVQGITKKLLSKKNEPKSNSQTGWIAVNVYVPFGPWTNSPPWSKKQFHSTLTHLWIRLL